MQTWFSSCLFWFEWKEDGVEPVSYTHLDVYKRQVQGFGVREERLIDLSLLLEGHALGTMGLGLGEFSASVRAQQLDQFPILVMLRDLKGGLSMALLVCGDALFQHCLLYTSRCV